MAGSGGSRALIPAGFDHIFSGHFHGHRDFPDLGWTFIGSQRFSATGVPELRFTRAGWLLGDTNGDGCAVLKIHLLGVQTFNPDWIS